MHIEVLGQKDSMPARAAAKIKDTLPKDPGRSLQARIDLQKETLITKDVFPHGNKKEEGVFKGWVAFFNNRIKWYKKEQMPSKSLMAIQGPHPEELLTCFFQIVLLIIYLY